tara:strand:+ start:758 stop:3139 length:2382 start_codon:yes stop_codon:yes gene_type:complete
MSSHGYLHEFDATMYRSNMLIPDPKEAPIYWTGQLLRMKSAAIGAEEKEGAAGAPSMDEFEMSAYSRDFTADPTVLQEQQYRNMDEVLYLLMNPPSSTHGLGFEMVTEERDGNGMPVQPFKLKYNPGLIHLFPYLRLALDGSSIRDKTNMKLLNFLYNLTKFWMPVYTFASNIPSESRGNPSCASGKGERKRPKLTDIQCFGNYGPFMGLEALSNELLTVGCWYKEKDLDRYSESIRGEEGKTSSAASFQGSKMLSSMSSADVEKHKSAMVATQMALEIMENDILEAFKGEGQEPSSAAEAERYYIHDSQGLDRIVLDVYEKGQGNSRKETLGEYIKRTNRGNRTPETYRHQARASYIKMVRKFYHEKGNSLPFEVKAKLEAMKRTQKARERGVSTKSKRESLLRPMHFPSSSAAAVESVDDDDDDDDDSSIDDIYNITWREFERAKILFERRRRLREELVRRGDAIDKMETAARDKAKRKAQEAKEEYSPEELREIGDSAARTIPAHVASPLVSKSLRLEPSMSPEEWANRKVRGLLFIPSPQRVILIPSFFNENIQKQIRARMDRPFDAYLIYTKPLDRQGVPVERYLVLDESSARFPSIPRIITPTDQTNRPYNNTCLHCGEAIGSKKKSVMRTLKRAAKRATGGLESGFCSRACQSKANSEAEEVLRIIYENRAIHKIPPLTSTKVKDKMRIAENIKYEIIRIAQEKLNELFEHIRTLFKMQELLRANNDMGTEVRSFGGKRRKPRKTRKFKKKHRKSRKTRKFKKKHHRRKTKKRGRRVKKRRRTKKR